MQKMKSCVDCGMVGAVSRRLKGCYWWWWS